MRILATADLHYALRQFDWLEERLDPADLLILAGDLLDLGSPVDLDVQEVVVRNYLRRYARRCTVLCSSGNHDIRETLPDGERVARWMETLAAPTLRPDYTSWQREEVLFTICPWWDGEETREKTEARLAADAGKPKRTWIWLHHAPPEGTPIAWTGKRDGGDPVVREWIAVYQPDLVFSGHIHHAPFHAGGSWHTRLGKTCIFNAGRQSGGEPAHLRVDLPARRARWFSAEESETIDF